MGTKVGMDVSNLFTGVEYSQEVHQLEAQVEALKTEIEQLRMQDSPKELEDKLEALRSELAEGGVLDIRLDEIDRNVEQPRQTFTEESIRAISRSLEVEGQQQPVILVKQESGRYLLFDGERRWRGAKRLEWNTLRAVIIPDQGELNRRVLLASLHQEGLNSLDIAEAIIKEIASSLSLNPADIPRVLRAAVRRLERQGMLSRISEVVLESKRKQEEVLQEIDLNEVECSIFLILLGLQLNPASVNTNIFPMLGLTEDLKVAIRSKGLGGNHALALNRLTAARLSCSKAIALKKREKLVKLVLQDKISVAQTRKLVSAELSRKVKQNNAHDRREVSLIVKSLKDLELSRLAQNELVMLREMMKQTLDDIESALEEA